MIRFTLPWPPSVNNYWHRNGKTIYVSKRGKEFRNEVYYLCRQYKDAFDCDAALAMFIWVYPPDKRKRDLDNLLKATCDSLEYVAFSVGIYFKFFSSTVDSVAEQAVESVLGANGIDIDFSEDKKKR